MLRRIFDNLINGNLTDAKEGAKLASEKTLYQYARSVLGWSMQKSAHAAAYLKGSGDVQSYCDAK